MIRRLCIALAALCASTPALADISAGKLVDLGTVYSRYADPRRVTVWLPDGYSDKGAPYSVLYMHDGQNLFDPATGYGGMEWKIDETLSRLIKEKKVRPTIVVAIWNTPKRLRDYIPSKAFTALPDVYRDRVRGLYGGDPLSDGYLKFIVRELRPEIDKRFNVRTDRANTAIMGSSMGGLISLYAVDEYPGIFGAAGMVSTHWPMFLPAEGQKDISDAEFAAVSGAFRTYLTRGLPSPATHRLYFDHGSETLDAQYARYQKVVDSVVKARGYTPGKNWMTRNFPGQVHNEVSWASRVDVPLQFLLPAQGR